jgi:type IV pilus assembly protein PilM
MAAPNRILSLNIGMQTVGLAEFNTTPQGGLILKAFKLTELLADPAADATRLGQTKIAITEMMAALGVKAGKVNYSIAAQSVFTRFVKLPAVAADQVDQIIRFEAQQNVPFPIDEVVWDYQLVGDPSSPQIEVVLVAIKADSLDDINASVEDAGLQTGVVDVAPMALYNTFRYNYGEPTECSLLMDIGARTTNLIFIEPGKIFSRSIPIGGATISAAIAKDFDEPFGASEERKKANGFVSLGTTYEEHSDPDVARAAKIIRNSMTRLHSEISRSISFYRSQQQGSQPKRVFLCGGGSGMPYVQEFFQEKLHVPIEFFNPLKNVTVAPGVNLDEAAASAHVIGELVGLGLRSTTSCPMELNLQPAKVVKAIALAQKRPYIVMAGVCLLLCLTGWWLYYLRAASIESSVLEKLSPQITQLQGLENRFKAVDREEKAATALAKPITDAIEDRSFWVRVIDDLDSRLPDHYIWITSFEPGYLSENGAFTPIGSDLTSTGGGQPAAAPVPATDQIDQDSTPGNPAPVRKPALRIQGLYLDNPKEEGVIDDFLNNLAKSPFFEINLDDRQKINPIRSNSNKADWAYNYEFLLPFKKGMNAQ